MVDSTVMQAGRYKAYPEYKDSGVEWLGEIPSSWGMWKLAHAYESIGSGTTPSTNDESAFDGDIPWITTGELREKVIFDTSKKVSTETLSKYSALKKHPAGSIAIAMYGATIGRLGILGVEATTNQACCVLSKSNILLNKFLFYWLHAFREDIVRLSSGGGQPNINQEKVASLRVSTPSLKEQNQIIDFLDYETAKIDTLIEKQQRLIELLTEKRQAVISHAVTKGLNPDVPMKDSRVEWLGEVPAHWEVSKFSYVKKVLTDYTANGSFADLKSNVNYLDEPSYARLIRLTDLRVNLENTNGVWINKKAYDYLSKSALYGGEFLLANVGAHAGLFYQMPYGKGRASLAPNMFMAKFDDNKVSREFMAFVGQSQNINEQLKLSATASSAQPKLNKDDFKAVKFAFPNLSEQVDIVKFLNGELPSFDRLINKAQQAVQLMQERRTALISAAVTGKIDVRDWVKPE